MRCRLLLPIIAVSACQSVRQFVCHAAHVGFTEQKRLNGLRYCLAWTLLGACGTLCYKEVLIPHREKEGELKNILPIVDPLHISERAAAKNLQFCAHIESWGPKENYAKEGNRKSRAGSRNLLLNFGTDSLVSSERLKLNTWNFACVQTAVNTNQNYAKVGHTGVRSEVTWFTFNFCDPLYITGTARARQSCACNVCSTFDAAFAKLLWPLVSFQYSRLHDNWYLLQYDCANNRPISMKNLVIRNSLIPSPNALGLQHRPTGRVSYWEITVATTKQFRCNIDSISDHVGHGLVLFECWVTQDQFRLHQEDYWQTDDTWLAWKETGR